MGYLEMGNKKMNQKNLPWFPFYTAAWLGSATVSKMTMTERGIYVTLMSMCWQYGSVQWDKKTLSKQLGIDPRTLGGFMEKYMNLTQTLHEGSMEVTLPKVQDFALTLAKNGSGEMTEERRGDEKTRDEKKTSVASVSSAQTTKLPSPSQSVTPSRSKPSFDPLTYSEPVISAKGERLEYPSEDVHHALVYHFKHKPSQFWIDRVTSAAVLPRYIDTMYEQMVRDVGEHWTPPAAKAPVTRTVGDPSCRRCRGRGRVTVEASNGDRHSETCTACEPRLQVAKGTEWVDVE